ncbi:hypothetical protein MSAN_01895900 [Mycena sanguinolenta]|uniref:Uncharacterized protein n=1 Tax=Mycena sanguinolenta TaxID=230812 RepID=A0A8H6XR31_9AGAR|nr:hypothetical protein MSAN_01895900 [Mycena sanguinolenta]
MTNPPSLSFRFQGGSAISFCQVLQVENRSLLTFRLIVALEATKACAIVLGFPVSGTTLQRGSQVTATWGSTSDLTIAIGIRNASSIFPIVSIVDAQSFKYTLTLPEFALGDFTFALLNITTLDVLSGNPVHIVEDTTTSSSGEVSTSTPSPIPTTASRKSLSVGSTFAIVCGAVIAIGILGVLLVLFARRRRRVDANVDPFDQIHVSEENRIQPSAPPAMRFEKFPAVTHDGQGSLARQIDALRRQVENLRHVGDQPDRAADQVGILHHRIRMLERELESLGGPEPPPKYQH